MKLLADSLSIIALLSQGPMQSDSQHLWDLKKLRTFRQGALETLAVTSASRAPAGPPTAFLYVFYLACATEDPPGQ